MTCFSPNKKIDAMIVKNEDSHMHEVVINAKNLQNKIYTVRGIQVMLDSDLADLY